MDNNETIALDGNTVKNIKVLLDKKAEFQKAIESVDGMITTILNTVINVKGLTGTWEFKDMNLVKQTEAAGADGKAD